MASSSNPDAGRYPAAGSLVRQLSFGAALWVGTLGLIVASVSGWQYWRLSLQTIDKGLWEDAQALVDRVVVSGGLLEIEIGVAGGMRRAFAGDERYYAIYDADGQLLDGTSSAAPDHLTPSPSVRIRQGYREVVIDGPNKAVIVVGQALDSVYSDVRQLATSLSLSILVGAALTLPVAMWLRRQLARSVGQIDETARSLAPGKPARIHVERVADEFRGVADALNDAFDRLDEAVERERHLTSDASHELRTPVTALVAETQWALARPRSADEYRQSLEVCARQSVRMKELVESLLTLARLEAGALPPARDDVELRRLIDDTIADIEPLAKHHHVTIRVDGEALVWADGMQMRILLLNLLSNAVHYNRPNGEVLVDVSTANGHVILRVSNTGAGLDPDIAAHAFERFWRANPARSARSGGSGLGLAISKAIVDAHAGCIAVEGATNQMTTFRVELPSRLQ